MFDHTSFISLQQKSKKSHKQKMRKNFDMKKLARMVQGLIEAGIISVEKGLKISSCIYTNKDTT